MWQRNNGQAEDDLQFRFTAYLVSAVKRRRKDYLIQFYKRSSIESTVEVVYESEPSSEEVVLDRLPLMDVIENGALLEALQKLNERERQIGSTMESSQLPLIAHRFQKPDIIPQCVDCFVDIAIAGSKGMDAIKIPKAKNQFFPQKLFQLD